MPEPAEPPELDQTADAKPYEPPKPRRNVLSIVALLLIIAGVGILALAARVRAYALSMMAMSEIPIAWWDRRLGLLAAACGIAGVLVSAAALVRMRGTKDLLRKTAMAGAIVAGLGLFWIAAVMFTLQTIRGGARTYNCKGHLRQIGLACHVYADENDGAFPASLQSTYPIFIDNRKVFVCPGPQPPPGFWEAALRRRVKPADRNYVYVSGLRADDPGDCVLAFDRLENHGHKGRNVLFADAHVSWIGKPEPQSIDGFQVLLDQTREAVRKRGGEIRLMGE